RAARVVVEDVDDHADLASCVADRLADVAGLELRELLAVLVDGDRDAAHEVGPVLRRYGLPGRVGGPGFGDRSVRVLNAGFLQLGEDFLGCRFDDGDGAGVCGSHAPLPTKRLPANGPVRGPLQ